MTPEHLAEIAKTIGVPAAILLFMWLNRSPAPKTDGDPAKQLLAKLEIIEDRLIDVQAEIKVLLDRRK